MVPMPMMPLGLTIWAIVRADEKDDRGESKDRYAMRRGKHSKYGAMGEVKIKLWLCGGNGESRSSLDS